ncbi:MAG: hypothetical protein IKU65_03955 [Oscillospiraceae bacterium]|nr:hypothetical protein [Oscillospiraceae bacterium]
MSDVRKKLGIKFESPFWDEAYSLALSEPRIPEWLTEEYIRALHSECNALPKQLDVVLSALPCVTEVPELCLLAKTIYHILGKKKGSLEAFPEIEFPKAPEGVENTIGYDCFAIFPVLAHIRPTWAEFAARGVEADILRASLIWADSLFGDSCDRLGKPSFAKEEFMVHRVAIYSNHLTIGSLRFEIHQNSSRPAKVFANRNGELCALMCDTTLHKCGHILGSYGCTDENGAYTADLVETDDAYIGYAVNKATRLAENERTTLSKSEWTPIFVPGDDVIKVHIPGTGDFSKDAVKAYFARAREVFNRCFPEITFKGFVTICWMLSPELSDILKPTSNILAFQNNFFVYPAKNSATDAFLYVFDIRGKSVDEIDFSALPEGNSLMRGIKKKALDGTFVHQFNGFIPW